MNTTTLLQLAEQLPLQAQIELQDFAEFLVDKYRPEHPVKPNYLQMNWAGALREYNQQFTSLDLQKQALVWREQNVSN